jgi:hypothetical protein
MYEIHAARVKLSNLISNFKFINPNQVSIHLSPVMHLYALHSHKMSVSNYQLSPVRSQKNEELNYTAAEAPNFRTVTRLVTCLHRPSR